MFMHFEIYLWGFFFGAYLEFFYDIFIENIDIFCGWDMKLIAYFSLQ